MMNRDDIIILLINKNWINKNDYFISTKLTEDEIKNKMIKGHHNKEHNIIELFIFNSNFTFRFIYYDDKNDISEIDGKWYLLNTILELELNDLKSEREILEIDDHKLKWKIKKGLFE
jgi:hypothetical protein